MAADDNASEDSLDGKKQELANVICELARLRGLVRAAQRDGTSDPELAARQRQAKARFSAACAEVGDAMSTPPEEPAEPPPQLDPGADGLARLLATYGLTK